MTEKNYKELLIEQVLECEEVKEQDKYELYSGLRLMELTLEQTTIVKRYTKEFAAYIIIQVIPRYYSVLKRYSELLEKLAHEFFNEDGYILESIHIKPKDYEISEDDMPEVPTAPINVFTDIENTVIDHIREAKWQIWIAMAWFTNPKIYEELLRKKTEGINVEIVLDDNEKNRSLAENAKDLNIHFVKPINAPHNSMHLKFCVVDMKVVLYGSYNWTNAANFNDENCTIDPNLSSVMDYTEQFGKLRNRAA